MANTSGVSPTRARVRWSTSRTTETPSAVRRRSGWPSATPSTSNPRFTVAESRGRVADSRWMSSRGWPRFAGPVGTAVRRRYPGSESTYSLFDRSCRSVDSNSRANVPIPQRGICRVAVTFSGSAQHSSDVLVRTHVSGRCLSDRRGFLARPPQVVRLTFSSLFITKTTGRVPSWECFPHVSRRHQCRTEQSPRSHSSWSRARW